MTNRDQLVSILLGAASDGYNLDTRIDLEELADYLSEKVVLVKRGRWEANPHAYGFDVCSACHDCNIWGEWADGKKWNYCPNCGAKMDLEE